jgi:hypothetical protein
MSRELYERCTACGGSGRIDPARFQGWRHRPRPGDDGKVTCVACRGEKYVPIGLTADQVEKMVERETKRQMESAHAARKP